MSLAEECLDDRPPQPTDELPEPPGSMLRTAREARGLTLDDIARTTKIGKSTLVALEASDVLRLPAAIYTRGFVKAYAHEVGLHPDETADEYLRRIEPRTSRHLLVDDGMLPPLADTPGGVHAPGDRHLLLSENHVRGFGRLTSIAAVIGLIVYLMSFGRDANNDAGQTSSSAQATADAAPAVAGQTSMPSSPDVVAATLTGPLHIELTPQGPCWLVATVDGERVLARLLQPGERQTLAISQEALLRVGDPGVLTISINGQSGRILGPPGQPVNVKITKENFKNFLSS